MAKDPGFIFYPGDYLRDTQTLSENSQVAYDRIMCEHMRNICISQKQLKFFTKRLSEDETEELMFVLTKVTGGFQIEWVAESIIKRKAYSESRRKNRANKTKEHMLNTSSSYVKHMENEDENDNEIEKEIEKGGMGEEEIKKVDLPFTSESFKALWHSWKMYMKNEKDKPFKSMEREQASLMELYEKSGGDETKAFKLIQQNMEGGYARFYPLKNENNGTQHNNAQQQQADETRREYAKEAGLIP